MVNIVVTGIGLIGSFGSNEAALASALAGKTSCVGACNSFETTHQVGEVRDFRLSDYIKHPRAERSPRISQFTLAAAVLALKQAGLQGKQVGGESIAIVYGTGNGPAISSQRSLDAIVNGGLAAVEPLVFQESVFNAPTSLVSIQFGITGPVIVLPMGWTAGLHAIKQGCDLLRRGLVERVLVIAADELASATHEALGKLGFVSPNDGGLEATRPFDRSANGAIIGEGAAALLLELEPNATARGATPRARISGCAVGGDAAGTGIPSHSSEAMVRVMRRALAQADKRMDDIDHVLAGTMATRSCDKIELDALEAVFTGRISPCPVTSIKSALGEPFGPFGLFNAVAGVVEIESGRLFANLYLDPPQRAGIELLMQPREQPVRTVLINSIGVCGTYASIVLEAV